MLRAHPLFRIAGAFGGGQAEGWQQHRERAARLGRRAGYDERALRAGFPRRFAEGLYHRGPRRFSAASQDLPLFASAAQRRSRFVEHELFAPEEIFEALFFKLQQRLVVAAQAFFVAAKVKLSGERGEVYRLAQLAFALEGRQVGRSATRTVPTYFSMFFSGALATFVMLTLLRRHIIISDLSVP